MTDHTRLRRLFVFIIVAIALLTGIGGRAQTRRAMAIDDLLTAIRVTEPALSSDGRLVAYVRTTTDLQSGRRNGDVYVVPADGSALPRLLAGGAASESTPQFSPDSKQVAFISSRDGAPQVYTVAAGGGEPKKITSLSTGVQPPLVFSPDGAVLAASTGMPLSRIRHAPVASKLSSARPIGSIIL